MKRVVAAGFLLVISVELMMLVARDRQVGLAVAGAAMALTLLALRWYLVHENESTSVAEYSDSAAESLDRWLARTETLISRAESTRRDWDRHLRPMLARQFELSTGQRRTKDPHAYHATGRMLFGDHLWEWVNPENSAKTGLDQPAPGRKILDEILQRLERV